MKDCRRANSRGGMMMRGTRASFTPPLRTEPATSHQSFLLNLSCQADMCLRLRPFCYGHKWFFCHTGEKREKHIQDRSKIVFCYCLDNRRFNDSRQEWNSIPDERMIIHMCFVRDAIGLVVDSHATHQVQMNFHFRERANDSIPLHLERCCNDAPAVFGNFDQSNF